MCGHSCVSGNWTSWLRGPDSSPDSDTNLARGGHASCPAPGVDQIRLPTAAEGETAIPSPQRERPHVGKGTAV